MSDASSRSATSLQQPPKNDGFGVMAAAALAVAAGVGSGTGDWGLGSGWR